MSKTPESRRHARHEAEHHGQHVGAEQLRESQPRRVRQERVEHRRGERPVGERDRDLRGRRRAPGDDTSKPRTSSGSRRRALTTRYAASAASSVTPIGRENVLSQPVGSFAGSNASAAPPIAAKPSQNVTTLKTMMRAISPGLSPKLDSIR